MDRGVVDVGGLDVGDLFDRGDDVDGFFEAVVGLMRLGSNASIFDSLFKGKVDTRS